MARGGARVLDRIQGLRSTYARPDPTANTWVIYQYRFGRRCAAALFIDGMPKPVQELERIRPDQVQAVEVYDGNEVPGQFRDVQHRGWSNCGAVVVWLKTPTT